MKRLFEDERKFHYATIKVQEQGGEVDLAAVAEELQLPPERIAFLARRRGMTDEQLQTLDTKAHKAKAHAAAKK